MRPMTRLWRLAAVMGLATFAACSSGGADVQGTDWMVVSVGDLAAPDGSTATLTYDGERVAGSTGCNSFTGDATFEDGSADIGLLAVTLMACPDPEGAFEQAFLAAMESVTSYAVDGDTLALENGDGNAVITLEAS
jgi:heat shock protein HslJ